MQIGTSFKNSFCYSVNAFIMRRVIITSRYRHIYNFCEIIMAKYVQYSICDVEFSYYEKYNIQNNCILL